MTAPDTHAAAVQIAAEMLVDVGHDDEEMREAAEDVVAALARAGWLHDPAEVAALRAERHVLSDMLRRMAMRVGYFRYLARPSADARFACEAVVSNILMNAPADMPVQQLARAVVGEIGAKMRASVAVDALPPAPAEEE